MKPKILYHVRSPNGVTVDLLETRGQAMALATRENCEVFELHTTTARAVKIRSAQTFKAREHDEIGRPVSTPATRRTEARPAIGFSFSQPGELAAAS